MRQLRAALLAARPDTSLLAAGSPHKKRKARASVGRTVEDRDGRGQKQKLSAESAVFEPSLPAAVDRLSALELLMRDARGMLST